MSSSAYPSVPQTAEEQTAIAGMNPYSVLSAVAHLATETLDRELEFATGDTVERRFMRDVKHLLDDASNRGISIGFASAAMVAYAASVAGIDYLDAVSEMMAPSFESFRKAS